MKLAVELRETGPVVRGGVRVLEGGSSRGLSVSLQYVERSPDYTHVAMEVPGGTLQGGDLQTGAWFDFAIPMPADALPGQSFRHGETFWQVDVKSDERGPDTHAVARLTAPQPPGAVPPPPPPPAAPVGPAPADAGGVPLLAPGYSARAESGTSRAQVGAVLSVLFAIAVTGFGIWQVVEGLSTDETATTVPIYRPQPYTPPLGGEFDLNACNAAAVGDPDAQLRCIREYNRRITETR